MQRGTEEEDRRARLRLNRHGLRVLERGAGIMAPRPDQGGAVFSLERRNRPHHVDEIFDLAGRAAPHILIPVGKLRRRAGMQFERLRQVELDGIAPGVENGPHQAHDRGVAHESLDSGYAFQKAAKALGARTVEAALTKGCGGKPRIEGLIDFRYLCLGCDVPQHAEAVPLQIVIDSRFGSLAIGGEICHGALLKQPWLDRQGRQSARCRWPAAARGCGR